MHSSESTTVHGKPFPCSQGYTMVELVLVMVLIAVLSVVVIPKFAGFFDTTAISVDGAAGMVAADIRYTQELAMSAHTSKTIVLNTGDNFYTVDSRNVNLPSKVTISNGDSFNFNPLGEPDFCGSVQVGAGDDCKKICVAKNTGQVSVVYPCTDSCPPNTCP